jgi:hypothetical protein
MPCSTSPTIPIPDRLRAVWFDRNMRSLTSDPLWGRNRWVAKDLFEVCEVCAYEDIRIPLRVQKLVDS